MTGWIQSKYKNVVRDNGFNPMELVCVSGVKINKVVAVHMNKINSIDNRIENDFKLYKN